MFASVLQQIVAENPTFVKRITVDEYERIIASGVIRDGQQVELIDGILVNKDLRETGGDPAAHGPRHAMAVRRLARLDGRLRAHGLGMQTQLPISGREKTTKPGDTEEAFMRHRSLLMQAELSSIPKDSTILSAQLVVTRALANDLKLASKPNLWVAEPCNRDWDAAFANCYYYAKGKHWKGVSGLYYGEDPDFWPLFIAHGPSGGGAVNTWDFTEAVKFWFDGQHANHGFFLYGDSNDYMRMHTPRVKDIKLRPAIMVMYDLPVLE